MFRISLIKIKTVSKKNYFTIGFDSLQITISVLTSLLKANGLKSDHEIYCYAKKIFRQLENVTFSSYIVCVGFER